MNKKENTRIAILETGQKYVMKKIDFLCSAQKELDGKIDEIMANHLPHIRQLIIEKFSAISGKIKDLDKKIGLNQLRIGGVFAIGAIVGGIIGALITQFLGGK